ncbi:NitT/TauT family transport system ATP-binding protein [Motilibacter rhizosphaerae]|uniref:NitT/TauT family transport system ATP-binding protein n=1 Tax=Motilibacter rhizosphaerae TaxID=598652 RepID=A0A4Q7NR14_9ACTN|nr:ABC transporter ATP-binding protein [Motilibacter rhizosphaerae]RZS89471.1 NitT/TauT family transport system ATP-binding protein [Motilibacter rhizosphaerae]
MSALDAPAQAAGLQHGPLVSVHGVRKAFGRGASATFALDRVSLDVAPGEFVALLGASGCGKSTLLSLIAGLDAPTAGTVTVNGGAALMPQEGGLFPWLTAGRNIELALRLRGVPRAERRPEAERLLSLVRLDGAYAKRPHELSGGMRQRVALARALAQQRPVLLMDEPFSALDAITRDALHAELVRVWQETGVAVVFVTHNVREAVRLGQRVVLLSSRPGRVLREWRVDLPQPRRIEDESVSRLAGEITEHLSAEIRRHAGDEAEEAIDVR